MKRPQHFISDLTLTSLSLTYRVSSHTHFQGDALFSLQDCFQKLFLLWPHLVSLQRKVAFFIYRKNKRP